MKKTRLPDFESLNGSIAYPREQAVEIGGRECFFGRGLFFQPRGDLSETGLLTSDAVEDFEAVDYLVSKTHEFIVEFRGHVSDGTAIMGILGFQELDEIPEKF